MRIRTISVFLLLLAVNLVFNAIVDSHSRRVYGTLNEVELSNLFGGQDSCKICGVIPDCETIGPEFCSLITGSINAQRCSQSSEAVPVSSVNNRDCILDAPPGYYCTVSEETNWCNIEYACRWDDELQLCYRSTIFITKIRSPVACTTLAPP